MSDSPAEFPLLIVTGGPFDSQSLALEASVERILGSGPNSHMRLQVGNVEAAHARVVWEARGVLISDEGTATGTYVNGEKIGAEHPLKDGDRVFLGPPGSKQSVKFVVRIPENLPAAAPAPAHAAPLILEPEAEPLILDGAAEAPPLILDEPEPPPQPAAAPPPPKTPAATPTAPAAPPAAASAPAPHPPERKKPLRPEYTSDMPSIVTGDRVREAVEVPPVAVPAPAVRRPAPRKPGPALPAVPRAVLVGALTAAVTVGGFLTYRYFQKPPPVLLSIVPPKSESGQTVSVSGMGFGSGAGGNTVRFGDRKGEVISASEAQLAVTVPEIPVGAAVSDVQVTVETRAGKSNALVFKVSAPPRVTALEPDVALPGDEVVASGQNLAGEPITVLVGHQRAQVVDVKPGALRFRVPEVPAGQRSVPVVVQIGAEAGKAASLLLGRLPLVLEARPPRGLPGERVVLAGRGFDPNPQGNTVTFAGQPALVVAASANELTVIAPAVAMDAAPVVVQALGKTSSEYVFRIARVSAAFFTPRYFPAPVPEHASHDHAFVSTELGPLLLLSGKADAASTVERAERVAATLNALSESASTGRPAAFELREKPILAVGVVGNPQPLVVVTPADAAGYDEPWDSSAKGKRSSPQGVASYWTALLQDYLALFVQHRRPFRVVELSPRGRTLLEMRTRPGSGVPIGAVSPLPPATARALREMALLLPSEGQPSPAAAAVEGRWEGTLDEGDAEPRPVTLRLRFDGSRLAGSVTTRSGGVAMDIPLREASYAKGTLRFVLALRGSPRYFVGTLDGESVTGTIHASADAKDALGRFSLRYLE